MHNLLNQTCTIYYSGVIDPITRKTTWDKSLSQITDCRMVMINKLVGDKGQETMATGKLTIADKLLNIGQRVDYNSKSYIVMSVKEWRDRTDLLGCLCYLGDHPNA
jgi:hypothetical protein